MSLWTILEAVVDIFDLAQYWRFVVCLAAGIAAAVFIAGHVANESLSWGLIGGTILIAVVIGIRWERSS